MLADGVDPFLGGLRGHHRVLPHLEEAHQGMTHRRIVLDDEDDRVGIASHAEVIGQ